MLVKTKMEDSTCNEENKGKHHIQHRNLRLPAVGYGSHHIPKITAVKQGPRAVKLTACRNLR
ncbi:hypothetical protein HanRHA438_Chr09g0384171 [Helianthus annuus]|nr:hypothetical protein HanIR_Chr09g0401631 [Helianthus annuus]KAJ0541261.1 hypothetical protein HanHA89_Chr09g0326401 [Helianthus annuus]KAJ0706342.1 hypothetical protein HanLR1_Chr09g0305891 [Helianthus annuus]KAJ0886858.1 hypothetical protein HanRHA438_Chr09g0384171 [Helianthus annuus]